MLYGLIYRSVVKPRTGACWRQLSPPSCVAWLPTSPGVPRVNVCPTPAVCRALPTHGAPRSLNADDVPGAARSSDPHDAPEPPTTAKIYVVNFYHLADVQEPEQVAERHKEQIRSHGWDIRGRIYLSSQGINAQFSAPDRDATAYTEWVAARPEFTGLEWRTYTVHRHMFPKLRLKFKPNLISLQGGMSRLPVTDPSARAQALAPGEWKRMLAESIVIHPSRHSSQAAPGSSADSPQQDAPAAERSTAVLLDVRNGYEWDAGHFRGAARPPEDAFVETPLAQESEADVPEALKGVPKDANIMMYCTGGIRCDVYSTALKAQGFKNLYTLQGGIQNYLDTQGSKHWDGSLYVFDERMAVAPGAMAGPESSADAAQAADVPAMRAAQPCALCGGEPLLPHVNCANIDCNLLFLACADCRARLRGCCCEECRDLAPRLLRPPKEGAEAYKPMGTYAGDSPGSVQRLLSPERIARTQASKARRQARLRERHAEAQRKKQERKALARAAMEQAERAAAPTAATASSIAS